MGILYTSHLHCVSRSLDFLMLKLNSKSRIPISDISGYHCSNNNNSNNNNNNNKNSSDR